jgi:hypothetical protein
MHLRRYVPTMVLAAALSGWSETVSGQMCVGDCDRVGVVGVSQLLVMVNVALGIDDPSACTSGDANGDRAITVDEIVIAVRNALTGCAPDISGAWLEDQVRVTASTCAPQVTQAVEDAAAKLSPCLTQVTVLAAGQVFGVDCDGVVASGEAEPNGVAHFDLPVATATANGCTVSGTSTLSIDLSRSPTTAHYDGTLRFAGTCPLPDCQMAIESTWTRQ